FPRCERDRLFSWCRVPPCSSRNKLSSLQQSWSDCVAFRQRRSRLLGQGCELAKSPKWCEVRQTVFGWTTQKFPFGVKTVHTLKIREQHVITVAGKAFYDIGHAPADHSNRRSTPKGYAVWEIHPVMKMDVIQ